MLQKNKTKLTWPYLQTKFGESASSYTEADLPFEVSPEGGSGKKQPGNLKEQ